MQLKLEEKENKKIVGFFPGILDEVRHNIRDLRGENANIVAPNEDEQKIIVANEEYAKRMEDILWLGEDALNILQNYKGTITDISSILYILKGFTIYALNRYNELDRAKKEVSGEQFYYRDDEKKVSIRMNTEIKDDDKVEDLSYTYNKRYSREALLAEIGRVATNSQKAMNWVVQMINSKRVDALPKRENEKFRNLAMSADLINRSYKMMNTLLETIEDKEQYKICQNLFINYNSFLERVYMECWAFKVNNNL